MNRLQKGSFAPNFHYQTHFDTESKEYFIESQDKKSILFFLRYVGCLVCQLDIKRINDNLSSFRNKNTEVFVVLQSTNESIETYMELQQIDFKIVSDTFSKIYNSYAVKKGNLFQFLSPKSIPKVIKSMKYGFRHGKFEGEETQLPAVFIVDENHKITYCYYGKSISDLPSIDVLLQKI
jgi:peroxiredoxin